VKITEDSKTYLESPKLANGERKYQKFSNFVKENLRIIAPILTLSILMIFFSFTAPRFASGANMLSILINSSTLLIMCIGMTMVLLIGEIDLSCAYVMTTMAIMAGICGSRFQMSSALIIPMVFIAGIFLGSVNGTVTAYLNVPSFATTLAMWQIAMGINIYITKGYPIFEVPELLHSISNAKVGFIHILPMIAWAFAGVFYFVLQYTRFGRYVYMVGGNSEAAKLAGVNVRLIRAIVFALAGFTYAVAGMLDYGKIGMTLQGLYAPLLIAAIASVVIGGTSLFGGEGGIPNTIVGVLIWHVLQNGLYLMDISIFIKSLVAGVLLLLALIFNMYIQKQAHLD